MNQQLPILAVIVPLLAAPLCILIRNRIATRALAVLVAWFCLGASITLLREVAAGGPISYHLGGWTPPLGIEYRVDLLSAYLLLIVSGIASAVLLFGLGTLGLSVPRKLEYIFNATFLLCMTGLMGISITGDAFNVFVFIEITSLSSYALIGMGKGRKALTAAFSYLVMGTIGGTFILTGIGLLYLQTGSLNMLDIAVRLQGAEGSRTVLVAFAFLFVGGSIKLAVFPLHQWLPNAYTYAPAAVSAFLAATATKVSYYVLVRMTFTIFGPAYVFGTLHFHYVLLPLSVIAMFVGSIAAIYQHNLKRLFAYSSVAQVGYMTLGLSYGTEAGLTGGLVHLFNHALMKGGLFLVAACLMYRLGSVQIQALKGIGRKMPLTSAAFVLGGLSLIGVPGTVGFISKWYFIIGALEKGWHAVAALVLLSSLLAVIYVWRVVEVLFFEQAPADLEIKEAPLSMLIPTWALIGATVVFGLYTQWSAGIAAQAASWLIGGGP